MWPNHVRLIGGILVVIVLVAALIKTLSRRIVGILTMAAGAVAILMCGIIGGTGPGLKEHLGIVIAGAILFGCGAIATAIGQPGN